MNVNSMKRISGLLLLILTVLSSAAFAQVKWLADASSTQIPDFPLTGAVNGSPFSFKYGSLDKTGSVGSGEGILFEHFTVNLRDDEKFWLAKFSIRFTVTVKKDELPDGKTFRQLPNSSPAESQPRQGDRFANVPEFLSLSIEGPSEFPKIGPRLSGSIAQSFSGLVMFGSRKNERIPVGLYLCFDDPKKSCVAGRAEVEIIGEKEDG